jgi:hypothetical protein
MNRCVRPNSPLSFPPAASRRAVLRRLLAGAGAVALAAWAVPAQAGLRTFPMGTRRGEITFSSRSQVQLDGNPELLGPGTRIHDVNNRLVFASTLAGQTLVVNYVRGGNRSIRDIWILTPGEIQKKLPPTQDDLNRLRQSQNVVLPSQPN